MSQIAQLKKIWMAIYEPNIDTRKVIEKYFHPAYEQCINGVCLHLPEYIEHVITQKKNIQVESIEYQYVLEKDNELFAIYYPKGKSTEGLPMEAEVICYFQFLNQKLLKIHGQVRLIKGDFNDVDMAK